MAGIISRRHLSFEEFLRWYEDEGSRNEFLDLPTSGTRTGYSHSLATVWSLERLEEGAGLLEVLSMLDPDRIYERFLTQPDAHIRLENFPKTPQTYMKARLELLQSSLVSRNTDLETLSIHRLIQDATRAEMSHERFRDVFEATVDLLQAVWPSSVLHQRHSTLRWRQCEPIFPHVICLKDLFLHSGMPRKITKSTLPFAEFLNDAGW